MTLLKSKFFKGGSLSVGCENMSEIVLILKSGETANFYLLANFVSNVCQPAILMDQFDYTLDNAEVRSLRVAPSVSIRKTMKEGCSH